MTEHDGVLGKIVQHSIDEIEVLELDTPDCLTKVKATCGPIDGLCPVTKQPDHYIVTIEYVPANNMVIESKSLKLYLWRYRDMGIACEALAAQIASDISQQYNNKTSEETPTPFKVHVTQESRGGIVLEAEAYA